VSDLPICLRLMADSQHATVIFQPLFVSGAISVLVGGFEIYVKAATNEVQHLADAFNDPTDGGRSLDPRRRFTLAHELAHTFFFEYKGSDRKPHPLVTGAHPAELKSLERECNHGAGLLLVPESVLEPLIRSENLDILELTNVRQLASRFSVSVQTLVIRLQGVMARIQAAQRLDHGGIFIISGTSSSPQVQSFTLTADAHAFFTGRSGVHDFTDILDSIPIPTTAEASSSQQVEVPCLVGNRKATRLVEISSAWVSSKTDGLLVGLRFKGGPVLA